MYKLKALPRAHARKHKKYGGLPPYFICVLYAIRSALIAPHHGTIAVVPITIPTARLRFRLAIYYQVCATIECRNKKGLEPKFKGVCKKSVLIEI